VINLAALKGRLADRAERLVVDLLGEPTARGERYWRWGNRGSFSYDFHSHHWHSFETDEAGDLLDLIQYGNPGWDLGRAIAWAREWIGDRVTGRRPSPPLTPAARLARIKTIGTRRAVRLWREARPPEGTPVETYLATRGLQLPGRSEHVLRFHPECPRGADRLPAMLGLMRGIVTDRMLGVHRTFLSADGRAKAAPDSKTMMPNKMMLGRSKGAVLKFTPDEDVTLGLALTEGIEDGLAVLAEGGGPVWVCLSAGAMAHFPLLGGIEALTVFSDNDAPGRPAAEMCAERWRAAGREARVVAPPSHRKDFGAVAEGRRDG
jgi:hypothetical protein